MRLSVRWVAHLADDRIAVERAYKAEDVALLSGDGVIASSPLRPAFVTVGLYPPGEPRHEHSLKSSEMPWLRKTEMSFLIETGAVCGIAQPLPPQGQHVRKL